jgi:hypothetical protein
MRTPLSFTPTPTTLLAALAASVAAGVFSPRLLAQDFNGNAVRDAVEIRNGTAPDCNRNGVPDAADILRPRFAAAVDHMSDTATLTNVVGMDTLDADGDGDLDLVVAARAQQNDSTHTIWRNDGGPGLVFAQRLIVTNALCADVRAVDLNADGILDLAAPDSGFAQVIVLLATAPGVYAAPQRLTAGSRGSDLAVADLDADGDLDLAMPGFATNAVDVFLNRGNGIFAARRSFACDQQPGPIAVGDFTGDGRPDLAVGNTYISAGPPIRTGTVSLLRNTGGGAFAPAINLPIPGHAETSANARPTDVALADADADGDLDLAVSSRESNSLLLFANDGTGTFTLAQTLGPLEVIGGDAGKILVSNLDADPAVELAWCDTAARAVRVYDNAAGSFVLSQSYASTSQGPVGIAAGDLTGDGLPELALAGNDSYGFATMVNQGGLGFDAVIHIRRTEIASRQVLADFTGDGITDLASYSTGELPAYFRVAPGIGDRRFGPTIMNPIPTGGHVMPRDLDNDGDLDVLSLGNSGNRFAVLNQGDGTFGPAIFSSTISVHGNWQTADLNRDGFLDMLWTRTVASNQPGFIAVSFGDGTGRFAPPVEITTPAFLGSVWTGDLSGDGAPELFVGVGNGLGNPGVEALLVYPNLGDGTFGPYESHLYDIVPNFQTAPGAFAWVDIDRDGDHDLLAATLGFFVYRNTNHQLEAPVPLGTSPDTIVNYSFDAFGPTIADFDLDGDLDFFGIAGVGGVTSPAVFFNNGDGTFTERIAMQRYRNSTQSLAMGDIDHDGKPDFLVRPDGYGDLYVHLNLHADAPAAEDCNANGVPDSCDLADGTSADANADGVPDECSPPCPADFNADGFLDFFDYDAFVACFEGSGTPGCGADFNDDGFADFFDYDAFVAAFEVGC